VLQGEEQLASLKSVKLATLLPQAQRQRRKYLLESEQEESEEQKQQHDQVINFWSSHLTKSHLAASALLPEPAEYFISHVWQPGDQVVNIEDFAEEKANTLKAWAVATKALFGEERVMRPPWFLLDTEEEQQMAMMDPQNSWQNMQCWVDKACAHQGFNGGAPPQEALRATKAALVNCQHFVALISHPGYFRRLWCCVEWAFFLSRVAPNYRDLEILLPETLQQPANWSQLVHAAAAFRLEDLRCVGDAFGAELHRELQQLAVDQEGFEGFMRASALALLTLQALLQQGEGCAAFGNAAFLEAAVEACEACGLRGLGKVLATAQPMLWWRSAYRQVQRQYKERHHSATDVEDETRKTSKGNDLSNDPLEMLVRYVNKKWFQGQNAQAAPEKSLAAPENAAFSEEGEEEESLAEDVLVEPDAAEAVPETLPEPETPSLTLASLAQTAEALLKQGADAAAAKLPSDVEEDDHQLELGDVEEEKAAVIVPQVSSREAGAYALRACEASAMKIAKATKLEHDFMDDMASWHVNFMRKERTERLPSIVEDQEEEITAGHVQEEGHREKEVRTEVESTAWKKILARSGAGLPDGYLDFWSSVYGEKLDVEAKVHARLFYQSWSIYHHRVCKWFDTYVVPFLEVWRQRGIRVGGIFEEAFSDAFLQVGGSIHDDLCKQLVTKQGLEESAEHELLPTSSTKPTEIWDVPSLQRLLAIQRKEVTFVKGTDQDRSMLPAILVSPLPLQLGKEPNSAVLCARPAAGDWRRACVAQTLGATGLRNGVYQLLTNFASEGCTDAGLEIEVIMPRLLLQVRGAESCEVVCGMRAQGFLEEKDENCMDQTGHSWQVEPKALEEVSGTEDENPSGSASSAPDTMESHIDWSPWVFRVPPDEAEESGPPRRHTRMVSTAPKTGPKTGHGPKALIDLRFIEHGVVGASLRPRKWWKEPTGAAERLLPAGVQGLPQKLPLISQQRFWHPETDLERGLSRAWKEWRSSRPSEGPRMIADMTKAQSKSSWKQAFEMLPKSARAKMLKSAECYKLKDSQWLWRCLVEGGPSTPDVPPVMEERRGSLQEQFDRLYKQLESTCFLEWVALGDCSERQGRPLTTGKYVGGGGALLPPPVVTGAVPKVTAAEGAAGHVPADPLDASSPCERCHQRALAKVSLKGSTLSYVWDAEACVLCLRCGFSSTDSSLRARLLEEETVLEATTSLLIRPGDGDLLQRSLARVLRVENNCCCVAMSQVAKGRAESRVATLSFSLSTVTTAAAATVVSRSSLLDTREQRYRPFASDQNWITLGLADTGLDLHFDRMRIYSVELAIQELDDKRMLRIRQEVSPLVMWLELVYLLSPDFSLIQWNRALAKVFGTVTLTAAVLMRMNINRLRQVVGAGPIPIEEPGSRPLTPTIGVNMWPVRLHRVVAVKTTAYEEILGVAMRGAGLMDGGLKALRSLGHERQMEHFAGVDDRFQQELAAGKQDVEKTSVSTAMAILAKTRSSVGTNSRALLQARRILKRKQVFLFLRDLYTNIVSTDHKEPEWLREEEREEAHEASEDGSSNSNEEEIVLDEEDEDLQIHAPKEVRERLDDAHKPQGLTIIKVLGHFSEYVHFSQMALMCIQVLGVMIRAALRVKKNANSLAMRHDNAPKRTTNIEQAMLTNGFVSSALKALYRHPTDPAICRETLLLLIYLATEDASHNEHVQAKMQLLEPPERPFTLLLTISKLSSLDDRSNLLLCLQVFIAIATFPVPLVDAPKAPASPTGRRPSRRSSRRYSKSQPQVRIGVHLAPMREAEAAQILVAVLGAHWRDKAVFTLVLRIVLISCDQPQLCRRFFEAGLSSQLRSFLRKVARGEVLEFWFEDVKERTGMKGAKSLRKAKEAVLARQRVVNAITEAENSCWQMLQVLAMNAGGGAEKAEQAHENYQHDTSKSIGQAIHELREATHNSQWSLSVKFLEAMLLYDFDAHAEFFHTQDGVTLALAELPNGEVAQIYPLLVAVLRLHMRSIPVSPYYSPVADDKVETLQRGDSFPRPMDLESKPMFPRLKHLEKRISAPELTVEGEYLMLSDRLTNAAKTVFAENAAARVLLESLMETKDLDLQDGLLRILSDLLQDKGLGAETAALEFKDFLLTDNGGSEVVFELMKGNLKNKGRVASALYALAGVVTLIPDTAVMMATELGSKVLIHTVWKYWMDGDIRRRTLMLLRRMRDAVPDLTAFMLKHWRANLSAMENGELKDPDATSGEEDVNPPVVPTVEEAPVTEVQETHEDDQGEGGVDPELAVIPDHVLNEESPKLTQLDEETLDEALKNSTEGRPESSFSRHSESQGDGTSPPPTQVASTAALSAPATEVRLPREMRHFFALLKVHRFEQKSSILAIPDVVKAIVDFKDDMELSRLGMRALMSGTAMEQEMRLPTIGRCPNFVKSVRRIMQKESMQDVIQLQLRLVLGILDNDPSDYQDWVECAVFAVSKVLQATMVWTTNSWEVVLQAISEAIRTPQGKILLQNFNVALSLYKAWEKLKDARDDALAKMIISSFLDQTERIMEMIG